MLGYVTLVDRGRGERWLLRAPGFDFFDVFLMVTSDAAEESAEIAGASPGVIKLHLALFRSRALDHGDRPFDRGVQARLGGVPRLVGSTSGVRLIERLAVGNQRVRGERLTERTGGGADDLNRPGIQMACYVADRPGSADRLAF